MNQAPRGPTGQQPTKVVKYKPGKATNVVWKDVVVECDGDPCDPSSVLSISGGAQLDNVVLRLRLKIDGNSLLTNVWCGAAAGLKKGYAEPILASDPDMQQENNHKALAFSTGKVRINRLSVQNNDDVLQLGGGLDFVASNSTIRLVAPYLGDHRDGIDVDDCPHLELVNCLVAGSGNATIFAKQEPGSGAVLGLLKLKNCTLINQWGADPTKRQDHMVWLGHDTRLIELLDNEWDARPIHTILVPPGAKLTQRGNVYLNSAPAVGKVKARHKGDPIQVDQHTGV